MQTGLIDKNGNKIEYPYYEIESLCKKIVENYCTQSEENNQTFQEFAKEYTYFSPYIDFVVGTLGYSLINPWLKNGYLLCGIPEKRGFLQKKYSRFIEEYVPYEYGKIKIGFSSDKDLKIKPFTQEKGAFYPCFITGEGMEFVPPVDGHRELARQLLNMAMIKDKEMCTKMALIDQERTDMAEVLMKYYPLLRFDDMPRKEECMIVYHADNISEKQKEIIKELQQEKALSFDSLFSYQSRYKNEAKDWSSKFLWEERRENDENKRL